MEGGEYPGTGEGCSRKGTAQGGGISLSDALCAACQRSYTLSKMDSHCRRTTFS